MTITYQRFKFEDRLFRLKRVDGEVVLVYERKVQNPGHAFLERFVDSPYWQRKHHPIGGKPGSFIRRLLKEADEILANAELTDAGKV